MGDIQSWWDNLPIVTKYLFVGSFGLTIAANFGLVSPMLLILDWNLVVRHFQIWRLVTCFLFHGALGFPFLINMLFLVRYAGSLESTAFGGKMSDYLYMLMVSCGLILVSISPFCSLDSCLLFGSANYFGGPFCSCPKLNECLSTFLSG